MNLGMKPAEFDAMQKSALRLGFTGIRPRPLVRSCYRAVRLYRDALAAHHPTTDRL